MSLQIKKNNMYTHILVVFKEEGGTAYALITKMASENCCVCQYLHFESRSLWLNSVQLALDLYFV